MSYVPSAYELVLLALASFRLTRLLGWDTFPPVYEARNWLLYRGHDSVTGFVGVRSALLADLFECAFCLGFWVGLIVYLAWLALPTATLAVSVVFALSAVVGLVAKTLDP